MLPQIVTQVETIYDFRLPTEVHRLLSYFRLTITLGIEGIPFECISRERYKSKLLFWIAAPAMICALVAMVVVVRLSQQQHSSPLQVMKERVHALTIWNVLNRTIPAVLYVAFAVYPIVSSAAFEAFSCYDFEGENGWLIADVGVECGSQQHAAVRSLAVIAIVCYPVGLWLLFAMLLFRVRTTIRRDSREHLEGTLAGSIAFLYREYEHQYWWWELVEMARRFLLVGLFVTTPAKRGSVMQIAVAAVVSLVYAIVQAYAQPYRQREDDLLGVITSFLLAIFFLTCFLLKYIGLTEITLLQERMSLEVKEDFLIDTSGITAVLIVCVLGTIALTMLIFIVQTASARRHQILEERERAARRLLHKSSHKPVELQPWNNEAATTSNGADGEESWHVFLSHVWGPGQEQMRIVKEGLKEMVPGIRVFLDVDDLEDIGDSPPRPSYSAACPPSSLPASLPACASYTS